jgi:hypothetical protein
MVINWSVFNQFQHVNAFWKRFAFVSHGKILKKCFFEMAEILKFAALIFYFFSFRFRQMKAFRKRLAIGFQVKN